MTFGSAGPTAVEGTIAPEGGCPGKFFTSRKWTFEQGGARSMRDHNGQPLAQLSMRGADASRARRRAASRSTLMR